VLFWQTAKQTRFSECAASKANKIIKHSGYIEGLQFDEHTLNIFRFDEVEEKIFVGREAPVRRGEDGLRRKVVFGWEVLVDFEFV
jgi:hypothetical protein